MRFLIMYGIVVYLMIAVLCSGCTSPTAYNLITPDRLGVGMSKGIMSAHGISNKFYPNQPNPMEMDMMGDTESTSIWLEWDFPQWEDPRNNYSAQNRWEQDMERYLQERVRVLEMNSVDA